MVFGTFDLLHNGHIHFLNEAKKLGDKLIVALATDNVVARLKGQLPYNSLARRQKNLKRLSLADEIIVGDDTLGGWSVIERYNPDIIALGYDQKEMAKELKSFFVKRRKSFKLVFVGPHSDQTLHSSILRSKMLE